MEREVAEGWKGATRKQVGEGWKGGTRDGRRVEVCKEEASGGVQRWNVGRSGWVEEFNWSMKWICRVLRRQVCNEVERRKVKETERWKIMTGGSKWKGGRMQKKENKWR